MLKKEMLMFLPLMDDVTKAPVACSPVELQIVDTQGTVESL